MQTCYLQTYPGIRALFLLLISAASAVAQLSNDSLRLRKTIDQQPSFGIYKDNYFITGAPIGETPNQSNADAKFQISFRHRVTNRTLPFGTYLFLTYTQKSFWDIYEESSPFAETNYNPGVGLGKLLFRKGKLDALILLHLEHELNGLPSENSRSWNTVALSYQKLVSDALLFGMKLWLPYGYTVDNEDLIDYLGYQELTMNWRVGERLIIDAQLRKAAAWNDRGSLQAGISYRPFQENNQYLYVQWWQGYAESLIDYQELSSMIRIGVTIKPVYPNYY